MTLIEQQKKVIEILKQFNAQQISREDTLSQLEITISSQELRDKELFVNLLKEMKTYLGELTRKEIKQRILMVESFE